MDTMLHILVSITVAAYTAFSVFALYHFTRERVGPPSLPVAGAGFGAVLWPAGIAGLVLALEFPGERGLLALLFLVCVLASQIYLFMEDFVFWSKADPPVSHILAVPSMASILLVSVCCVMDLAMLFTALVPAAAAVALSVIIVAAAVPAFGKLFAVLF